jgi:NAD(P)-dependent dehydrogenase (short-subunit alcohol dehydrogenase family)
MITHSDFHTKTAGTEVARAFADQIRDKTILITGCSPNNIGTATARAVSRAHASLIIISGQSDKKLDVVADLLLAEYPQLNIRKLIMDLSSHDSVRRAANEVSMYKENVDVLINCAAVIAHPT